MKTNNIVILNPYQLAGVLILLKGILSTFVVFAPKDSNSIWPWIYCFLGIMFIVIPYYQKTKEL